MNTVRIPALLVLFATLSPQRAPAQDLTPRFGLGVHTMLSSADGFGLGVRGRASVPVNADISAAADVGFTGFILGGRRDAAYIFDPQLSAIVSLPTSPDRLTYVMFGLGAYAPVGDDDDGVSGPTIHLGIGWVRALRESSFFYEIDPALIVGEDRVDVAVPLRIGVIF